MRVLAQGTADDAALRFRKEAQVPLGNQQWLALGAPRTCTAHQIEVDQGQAVLIARAAQVAAQQLRSGVAFLRLRNGLSRRQVEDLHQTKAFDRQGLAVQQ